ncbi:FitA-like ribbon-helix-helix domain-containing protein [Saccharopolyspora shandongensis]|uniref:FitA-like ribbon-helix-helix domain-containing protein n=1 Tax=Saccharopolyspora shandongensis TaxID=418495 RepID=UPI0033EFCF62
MSVITIRNVPDEVRDLLTRAAKRTGQSLQGYLLSVLEREARFSRNAELAEMEPVGGGLLSMDEIVEAVRAARGEAPGSGDQAGVE